MTLHVEVGRTATSLELEWLVTDPSRSTARPDIETTRGLLEALPELPRGGRVTIEPGGQLEWSLGL